MRFALVLGVTALALFAARTYFAAEPKVDAAAHAPIIVELFTSEGCSSCPPADRLLADLQKQSRPDAELIVLSEHVDYWDSQGWKDPFSARQFSDRQAQYAQNQMSDEVYTPQMFVDGHKGFSGGDSGQAISEIRNAAKALKTPVLIEQLDSAAGSTRFRITTGAGKEADLMLAITEDGLESKVARGENSGRFLAHTGVVRLLKKIGSSASKESSVETIIPVDPAWKREHLRAVAFLQRPSGLIVGTGAVNLR
ncbi:MAG TPA: DUF1223 domain-containing protein [Terriglobales bacterium]|nr:DUF1223 domain-containing protein [Terriglobales bacterium]